MQTRFIILQGERLVVDTPEQVTAAESALFDAGVQIAQVYIAFNGDFDDTTTTPDVIASAWFRTEAYRLLLG